MKCFAGLVALFGLFVACLPALDAQVAKDDPKSADEKKSDDKKVQPKKKAKVDEAAILSSVKLQVKIKDVRATDGDSKEIVVHGRDEKKYLEYVAWDRKFKQDLPRIVNLNEQQKIEYYKRETANHLDGVFSLDPKTVIITDLIRVRNLTPPTQLDDKTGKEKKLSGTELNKLKGNSRLPGYPVDFSQVRAGQIVDLYVPKSAVTPAKKAATPPPPPKKGFIGVDPNLVVGATDMPKMEAYLIVIVQE